MDTTHPEIREGEVFITNIHVGVMDRDTFHEIGWETKRKGNVAYARNGDVDENSYPVFIQLKEYEDKYGKVNI